MGVCPGCIPVFQVGKNAGNERLKNFLLANAAQEAQGHATDVLVGVLQVVAQVLADQDLEAQGIVASASTAGVAIVNFLRVWWETEKDMCAGCCDASHAVLSRMRGRRWLYVLQ